MKLKFFNKSYPLLLLLTIFLASCQKQKDVTEENLVEVVKVGDQNINEILGRPTNTSISMSILFEQLSEVYWEYGTAAGTYTMKTATFATTKDTPLEADFTNLTANTKYYYRTRYRLIGTTGSFVAGLEHTFYTQRTSGSTFTFTVESDPHPYDKKGCHNLWHIALQNQLNDNADFMFDLGDTFGDDHQASTITSSDVKQLQLDNREFFGSVCHSMPLYFCLGNHEGEKGYYLLQTPPNNLATYESIWRKIFYPNPFPDGFYTGNSDVEGNGIGKPENYYAFKWGDALFVVLDAYRYAIANEKPGKWEFTLGKSQYEWLKQTLESSNSKYKFVFAHHVRGEGRGGISNAKYFEWGGYEENSSTYSFTTNRPGWAKPIHKLFIDNGVDIFFQGHDHVFAHELLDNVTYQALPMPSDSTYQLGILANGDAYTSDVIDGSGHVRVTVSPSNVKVDYVQAYLPADENTIRKNRKVAFSYTIN